MRGCRLCICKGMALASLCQPVLMARSACGTSERDHLCSSAQLLGTTRLRFLTWPCTTAFPCSLPRARRVLAARRISTLPRCTASLTSRPWDARISVLCRLPRYSRVVLLGLCAIDSLRHRATRPARASSLSIHTILSWRLVDLII